MNQTRLLDGPHPRWILVTVSHEHFSHLRTFWTENAKVGSKVLGTSREEDERWGGKVLLIDWAAKVVAGIVDLPLATGLAEHRGRIYVCSYRSIHVFSPDLMELEVWRHPLFCNLHSISPMAGGGFLVTSSGIDTVLRVPGDGEAGVAWHGPDQGFLTTPDGTARRLDLSSDHSCFFYPTETQTTHVNSAVWDPVREGIVMTLFHQGVVLEAGKRGNRTLVRGLRAPHSVHLDGARGLYAADSAGARIVELRNGQVHHLDLGDHTKWLQSVQWWPEADAYLALDSTGARVLLVDRSGRVCDEFRTGQDWRLHQALPWPRSG